MTSSTSGARPVSVPMQRDAQRLKYVDWANPIFEELVR
jgi:hypothetical protein